MAAALSGVGGVLNTGAVPIAARKGPEATLS